MRDIDAAVIRLRDAYEAADRSGPGVFRFVASVGTVNGDCTCVVVVALNDESARSAAARAIAE